MQEAEWNLIEGTVEAVIYQNRENGYTVLRLDAGESGRGPRRAYHGPGDLDAPCLLWRAVQGGDGGAAHARRREGHF